MPISFNHRLPDSVDPGAIYLGYVFRVSPSGPRRGLHTSLPLPQLSLPNPPCSPLNYHNSTSIFSHDKCPMGNTSRLRPSAGVVLQVLLKHCSLPARANSSVEKDPSGCKFWDKNLKQNVAKQSWCQGFWCVGVFFWQREGWEFLFVCLCFWGFAGLFHAYLWNYNNCN